MIFLLFNEPTCGLQRCCKELKCSEPVDRVVRHPTGGVRNLIWLGSPSSGHNELIVDRADIWRAALLCGAGEQRSVRSWRTAISWAAPRGIALVRVLSLAPHLPQRDVIVICHQCVCYRGFMFLCVLWSTKDMHSRTRR